MTLLRKHIEIGTGLLQMYSSTNTDGHYLNIVNGKTKIQLSVDEASLEVFIDALNKRKEVKQK